MSDIAERVKKIVVEHLGVEPEKVVDKARFVEDLGADSLDVVELVMAFEEEFGVEIPDDAAETVLTVADAERFLSPEWAAMADETDNTDNSDNVVRVLVFGSSGAGKTSMLCELTKNEDLKVRAGVEGCTLESNVIAPVLHGDKQYVFTDTVGLNEDEKGGAVPGKLAIKNLINLLQNSENGYNLFIHVIATSRTTKLWVENSRLFCEHIGQKSVPTIIVFTGCEGYQNIDLFYETQKDILKRYGLYHKTDKGAEDGTVIGSYFHRVSKDQESVLRPLSDEQVEMRAQSAEKVWKAIQNAAAEKPIRLYKDISSLIFLIKRTCLEVAGYFGLKIHFDEKLESLLTKDMGYQEKEAQAVAIDVHDKAFARKLEDFIFKPMEKYVVKLLDNLENTLDNIISKR